MQYMEQRQLMQRKAVYEKTRPSNSKDDNI